MSSQALIAHSPHFWVVDSSATAHIARDRVGVVEYRRVPAGSRKVYMGNEANVEVLGIVTFKLEMRRGRTLYLHDVLYAPDIRRNLVSVISKMSLGFSFV